MNLYDYYNNPKLLNRYEDANDMIPDLFFNRLSLSPLRLKSKEHLIAKSPEHAYFYAIDILKGPFPKGEDAISTRPRFSYFYAARILGKRFPKGEKAIASSARYSTWYAEEVLKGKRFKMGEDAISSEVNYAMFYAMNIIKGRWPKGEAVILGSPQEDEYQKFIGEE